MTSNSVIRVQFLNSSSDFTGICSSFWLLIDTNIHKHVADVENLVSRRISAASWTGNSNNCFSNWRIEPIRGNDVRVHLFLNGGLLPSDEISQIIRDGDLISLELLKMQLSTKAVDNDHKNGEVGHCAQPKAKKSSQKNERKEKKKNSEMKSEQNVQKSNFTEENASHDCGVSVPLTQQELVNQLMKEQTGKGLFLKDTEVISKTRKTKLCAEVEKKPCKSSSTDKVDVECQQASGKSHRKKQKKRREKHSEGSYESADNYSRTSEGVANIVRIENQQHEEVVNESRQKKRRKRRRLAKKKEPIQRTPLPVTNTSFSPFLGHVKNKKIVFPDSDSDIQNPFPCSDGPVIPDTPKCQILSFESSNNNIYTNSVLAHDSVLNSFLAQGETALQVPERNANEYSSCNSETVNAGCFNSATAVEAMDEDGQQQKSDSIVRLEPSVDTKKIASEFVTSPLENGELSLNDNKPVNYENLADLKSLPRIGDRIAFKILELTESVCPQVSEYMEAEVMGVVNSTEHVQLKMLKGKVQENGLTAYKSTTDGATIFVAFKHLYNPKLMMNQ